MEQEATVKNVFWNGFPECALVKVKFIVDKIAQKSDKSFLRFTDFNDLMVESKDNSCLENNFVKLCRISSKVTY